ncbi:MAG: serine acetyltransferase [Planctomycetia bacterium]
MQRENSRSASFETIAASLLEEPGCGNALCAESFPLPCVESVMTIAHDLRDLLFPGIHRSRAITPDSAVQEYTEQLTRIHARLQTEIGLALRHSWRATPVLHVETGAARADATVLTNRFLQSLPHLLSLLSSDVNAAFEKDPAAKTRDEIILCYPGIEAITIYRIAHELLLLGVPYLPRVMTEWAHRQTGIDIHPGAQIGGSFFIDHGTGVVIGETCVIGTGVTLYQGVTLGAWSFPRDEEGNLIRGAKRHPTLDDNVTVYSNATILGGTTVIGAGSQIGSNVSLNRSVPPNTIVTIERPSLRFREAA